MLLPEHTYDYLREWIQPCCTLCLTVCPMMHFLNCWESWTHPKCTCTTHFRPSIIHPSIYLSIHPSSIHLRIYPSIQSLPWGVLPIGHAQKTSTGGRPGGILIRCQSHLTWLLLTWRSTSSTPSSPQISKLLTPSLRLIPATIWRKLFSATCIWDLILSVTTQSSWP